MTSMAAKVPLARPAGGPPLYAAGGVVPSNVSLEVGAGPGAPEHVVLITRHRGKPTSGRFVFRASSGWYWQCDLHIDLGIDDEAPEGPIVPTMEEAFQGALEHAAHCAYISAASRCMGERLVC